MHQKLDQLSIIFEAFKFQITTKSYEIILS